MAKQRFEVVGVVFLFGMLSLIATYPLILHFDTGLLYDSISGVKAWNRSGDQLQLLYWFWLVKENILGTVPFDSNPFEFNMAIPHETTGFATSPLAFLFFLFSPLGNIAAYNCTIITTYVLAGTFMYLLVKLYSGSRMGALLGAIIFTFAPSRINGVTGGNMYGMLFFLYPWILYFLEKGVITKKFRYGVLSGLGMLCLSMLEAHLLYYICIFLAAYLPLRIVMLSSDDTYSAKVPYLNLISFSIWSIIRYLLLIWGCGVVATLYSQVLFTFRDQAAFITPVTGWIFLAYPLIPVVISFFLASLYRFLFQIDIGSAIIIEAKSLVPVYILLPFGIAIMYGHATDTTTLVVSVGISIFILKLFFLREHISTLISLLTRGVVAQRAGIIPIFPVLVAIGYIIFWLPMSKESKFESTIAAAGRTLHDVRLYSAKLMDVITPESNVYIGIVTAAIIVIVLISKLYSVLRKSNSSVVENPESVLSNFYLCVACLGFLLSLGLALGKSSLYLLLYYYLPYFNYPRVSDRIIILTLFAVAILAGYVVKKIQRRSNRSWLFFINLILLIVVVGQLKDFNFFRPAGINILDKGQDIYTHVRENIGDKVLLEIPLWPGDSHQSSLYQHYIMQDRVPRVNGYSPLVRYDYLNNVFKPLAGMNKGRIGEKQWEILLQLGVKYITVHNNRDVFLRKVSPFGPITTARRFKSSPYLEFVDLDNTMYFKDFSKRSNKLYLFRVKNVDEVNTAIERDSWYEMPFYYYAGNRLHKQTGEIVKDKLTGRKVFRAVAGKHKQGFLVYGPYAYYTPGNYRCYFEVQTGKLKNIDSTDSPGNKEFSERNKAEYPARLEVVKVGTDNTLTILAQKDIAEGQANKSRRREYLDFTLGEFSRLEFRVYYYGSSDVLLEEIMVYPQMHDKPRYFLAAEKMVGSTGKVVAAENSSTGKVVEAVIRRNKKGDLVYGPNAIYPKGKYRARVYIKLKNKAKLDKKAASAVFSVTHGVRKNIIVTREIYPADLNEDTFRGLELDFSISRDQDLGFPVKFTGKANIQLDRIEIERLPD